MTENYSTMTALVTGANSGLGFKTAELLANMGFRKVIVGARSQKKADDAIADLTLRLGCPAVFDSLIIDLGDVASVNKAIEGLLKKKDIIDWLILNAGGSPVPLSTDKLEVQFRVHILGHHLLTEALLSKKRIAKGGRIIIASSEVSRAAGERGMPRPVDFVELAKAKNLELEEAFEHYFKTDTDGSDVMSRYATIKTLTNFWAIKLSQLVSDGISVNAVSPGAVPSTSYASNISSDPNYNPSLVMRMLLGMMNTWVGTLLGMNATVESGASRYIDIAKSDSNGQFWASKQGTWTSDLVNNTSFITNDAKVVDGFWSALKSTVTTLPTSVSA